MVDEPISSHDLQAAWSSFNARYFDASLPPIAIHWSRRLTASAGMFVSHVGPRTRMTDGHRQTVRLIRLSVPLLAGQSETEILGTLAHEMIHQWQFDRLKRRPNHGADFRRIMAAMNRDGLHITIRHSLDEAVDRLARYHWRCQKCGRDYRRHRKTIRPSRHRCGACLGHLRELSVHAREHTPRAAARPRRSVLCSVQLRLFI